MRILHPDQVLIGIEEQTSLKAHWRHACSVGDKPCRWIEFPTKYPPWEKPV